MCLIFLTCSLFLLIYVFHFIVCSSIDTPLYWFGPWPAFYHCLLCIRRFLVKCCVHMRIFGQKSRIHVGFWPKFTYTCRFLAKSCIYTQLFFKQSCKSSLLVSVMLWEVVGWVVSVVGSSLGLMLSVGCFFCDQRPLFHWFFFESSFSHFPFCFAISALLFLSWRLAGLVFYTCCRDWEFRWLLLHFSFFYIEKYKVVSFFPYGIKEVLALDGLDESCI